MLALACAAELDVTAVHIDHGLRAGDDESTVRALAERFGITVEVIAVDLDVGPNLEERARQARYAALPEGAMLGHTADDQAETVLLHLLRGSGLHGVAGMRREGRRPLLDLRRWETGALCDALGLETVSDPSNADPAFRRNRVRYELLPLMDDIFERDVVPLLCRFADLARSASDQLDTEAATIDVIDATTLASAPALLAGLAVRAWLASVDAQQHPPDQATIDRVLAVARGEAVATDIGRGWQVRRSKGRLTLER
jgi:tRNA(Ile)-lysidine synthase